MKYIIIIIIIINPIQEPGDKEVHSPILEVLHQALHVVQLGLHAQLLVAQAVQLSAQVGDVGLEHGVHVGGTAGLLMQQLPLGLQHLVLLLQEAHLPRKVNAVSEISGSKTIS